MKYLVIYDSGPENIFSLQVINNNKSERFIYNIGAVATILEVPKEYEY